MPSELSHVTLHITLTTFVPKYYNLPFRRIYIVRLLRTACRLPLCQRAAMLIPPTTHLNNKRRMPTIQSFQLPLPPQCLRMLRIALLAVHEYRPNRMQFPMLPQQMCPTKLLRRNFPIVHYSSYAILRCAMGSLVIIRQELFKKVLCKFDLAKSSFSSQGQFLTILANIHMPIESIFQMCDPHSIKPRSEVLKRNEQEDIF